MKKGKCRITERRVRVRLKGKDIHQTKKYGPLKK